ncbi:MAG: hydroxyacid dehydrogenase [Chlamydiae bacterium RIFCSPHIGHO2_12_FULL_49_9]|nr:MAG: hydroxyacid dehydrogenase [Chlamydiae bacterium RIFCSPHIGHO2_12_FULL_49_9]
MSEPQVNKSQILLYQTEDGRQRIEVCLENETVWLSQKLMAELFQTTPQNINIHLKNIFSEGELSSESVSKESLITASDGKKYRAQLYRLEAIIAIGYRVSSHRGTQFRQWATQRLNEYIVKGFTLDDERLSKPGGVDYFDELLDRIRAIRSSEKRFYQKIKDLYTLSADYAPEHPMTQEFFKTVQNKLLYAVTGSTAAEIIHKRANASKPNMGLTAWDGAGRGKTLIKRDVEISKNYLNHEEIKDLESLVDQYLDFAERQARHRKVMCMADWKTKLDAFLELNDEQILTHAGTISAEIAKELALSEYAKFEEQRRSEETIHAEKELREALQKVTISREVSDPQEI